MDAVINMVKAVWIILFIMAVILMLIANIIYYFGDGDYELKRRSEMRLVDILGLALFSYIIMDIYQWLERTDICQWLDRLL